MGEHARRGTPASTLCGSPEAGGGQQLAGEEASRSHFFSRYRFFGVISCVSTIVDTGLRSDQLRIYDLEEKRAYLRVSTRRIFVTVSYGH